MAAASASRIAELEAELASVRAAAGQREIAFAVNGKTWDTKREGMETEIAALRSCVRRAESILARGHGGAVARALVVLREITGP